AHLRRPTHACAYAAGARHMPRVPSLPRTEPRTSAAWRDLRPAKALRALRPHAPAIAERGNSGEALIGNVCKTTFHPCPCCDVLCEALWQHARKGGNDLLLVDFLS